MIETFLLRDGKLFLRDHSLNVQAAQRKISRSFVLDRESDPWEYCAAILIDSSEKTVVSFAERDYYRHARWQPGRNWCGFWRISLMISGLEQTSLVVVGSLKSAQNQAGAMATDFLERRHRNRFFPNASAAFIICRDVTFDPARIRDGQEVGAGKMKPVAVKLLGFGNSSWTQGEKVRELYCALLAEHWCHVVKKGERNPVFKTPGELADAACQRRILSWLAEKGDAIEAETLEAREYGRSWIGTPSVRPARVATAFLEKRNGRWSVAEVIAGKPDRKEAPHAD